MKSARLQNSPVKESLVPVAAHRQWQLNTLNFSEAEPGNYIRSKLIHKLGNKMQSNIKILPFRQISKS